MYIYIYMNLIIYIYMYSFIHLLLNECSPAVMHGEYALKLETSKHYDG